MAWLSSIQTFISPLVVLTAVISTIFTLRDSSIRRHSLRIADLEATRKALKEHYEALATILESPDVSDEFKMQLVLFSEQVTDKQSALELVREICSSDAKDGHSEVAAQDVHKQEIGLEQIDPKLSDSYVTLIASGIVAMFFRWPEGSKLFLEFVRRTISDRQREAEVFARAINRAKRQEHLPSNAALA